MTRPKWYFDDLKQQGVDFGEMKSVQDYEEKMMKFRDYEKEAETILSGLKADGDSEILEIGSGPGHFSVLASRKVKKVTAVDASAAMIGIAGQRARAANAGNITFIQGSFLSYEHTGNPPDAVVTNAALHHLPDFWKMVALKRIHGMLKPGGRFYLGDVVFCFPISAHRENCELWIREISANAGESFAEEAIVHLRDEYSTFDWIIEGMLKEAGFMIERADKELFFARYVCVKRE
jgi:putative AdoMet-dependent methyltransferase